MNDDSDGLRDGEEVDTQGSIMKRCPICDQIMIKMAAWTCQDISCPQPILLPEMQQFSSMLLQYLPAQQREMPHQPQPVAPDGTVLSSLDSSRDEIKPKREKKRPSLRYVKTKEEALVLDCDDETKWGSNHCRVCKLEVHPFNVVRSPDGKIGEKFYCISERDLRLKDRRVAKCGCPRESYFGKKDGKLGFGPSCTTVATIEEAMVTRKEWDNSKKYDELRKCPDCGKPLRPFWYKRKEGSESEITGKKQFIKVKASALLLGDHAVCTLNKGKDGGCTIVKAYEKEERWNEELRKYEEVYTYETDPKTGEKRKKAVYVYETDPKTAEKRKKIKSLQAKVWILVWAPNKFGVKWFGKRSKQQNEYRAESREGKNAHERNARLAHNEGSNNVNP